MEMKITDGRYVPAEQLGFKTVDGTQELAQRIIMKLTAKRGQFLPLPEYGSRLYLLPTVKPSQRETVLRQYVAEALSDESGVELETLELSYEGDRADISLIFANNAGTKLTVTTEI